MTSTLAQLPAFRLLLCHLCVVQLEFSLYKAIYEHAHGCDGISIYEPMSGYAAGISLYKDNLYVNLYVMPIFDVWNRI